jgi:hypothetical protein
MRRHPLTQLPTNRFRGQRGIDQSFRSCAYALIAFGDRSIPVKSARYRSTVSTGRSSSPRTVHDSRDETAKPPAQQALRLPGPCLLDDCR